MWIYELNTDSGIVVEKEVKDLTSDSAPGDTAEQIYTITAKESGTYELVLKSTHVVDKSDIKNEVVYIVNVID